MTAATGWAVAEARHRTNQAASWAETPLPDCGRGLLTVLDYAEHWLYSDLKHFLLHGLRHRTGPDSSC